VLPDRYSFEDASRLLSLYRRLFPQESKHWGSLGTYWDFPRSRQWSRLTTDFHTVSMEEICSFDAARRAWSPTGEAQEKGKSLSDLASAHGCGYSLGISPWTDSALHATVTPDTKSMVMLVGHDWYPIVPKRGPVEARPPLDIFPLLDSTDPQWSGYADGIPSAEAFRRAGVGLLFLNLVPDFRPPGMTAEKAFPFSPGFGYPECLSGLLAALNSTQAVFPLLGLITWGSPAWELLRGLLGKQAAHMGVSEAARFGGRAGFVLNFQAHPWRVHPFPHPTPSKRYLLWTSQLMKNYEEMWSGFL